MQACRISADRIACRRGERMLFAGLSLVLGAGQALQIGGANGTGKSSLLRMLAGLLESFAGRIERSGAVALLDERPALDPALPLGEALHFWQRLDRCAEDYTARLGLDRLLDVPVRFLSTGQKKRAALARMLGQQAPIWLLDEPLNGLDARGIGLVEELAAEHCRSGGIAVIASHQPFAMADLQRIELADFTP